MDITNTQKYVHSTPRKLRLVADMIRKMEPNQAIETLRFSGKVAAKDLSKAIKTALANAKVRGVENLVFKTIEINEGSVMKRFMAGTRGRAKPYQKRMAHIKIVLSDDLKFKNQNSKIKNKEDN